MTQKASTKPRKGAAINEAVVAPPPAAQYIPGQTEERRAVH